MTNHFFGGKHVCELLEYLNNYLWDTPCTLVPVATSRPSKGGLGSAWSGGSRGRRSKARTLKGRIKQYFSKTSGEMNMVTFCTHWDRPRPRFLARPPPRSWKGNSEQNMNILLCSKYKSLFRPNLLLLLLLADISPLQKKTVSTLFFGVLWVTTRLLGRDRRRERQDTYNIAFKPF